MKKILNQKKYCTYNMFFEVYLNPKKYISDNEIDDYIKIAKERIKTFAKEDFVFAYSAGKDSIALQAILDDMNINYISAYMIVNRLFCFDSVLQYVEKYPPKNLNIFEYSYRFTVDYIKKHKDDFYFSNSEKNTSLYIYNFEKDILNSLNKNVLVTGKRKIDNNHCDLINNKKNYTLINPMFDFPHEAIFGIMKKYNKFLPYVYYWLDDAFVYGADEIWDIKGKGRSKKEIWQMIGKCEPKTLEKLTPYFPEAKEAYDEIK